MWRRLLLATALVAPAVAVLPSDAATCRTLSRAVTHGAVVRVCSRTEWLHAPGVTGRLGNVSPATWSGTRPTASLAAAGGAAAAAPATGTLVDAPPGDPLGWTVAGTATGPVDNVAFDVYVVLPAEAPNPSRASTRDNTAMVHGGVDLMAHLSLDVDGHAHQWDDMIWLYRLDDIDGKALFKGKLAFTDLYAMTGPSRRTHRFRLEVVPDDPKHDTAVFLYDAVEVPSSVTFNAARLDGYARAGMGAM